MAEYEPNDSRIVTQNPSATPGEPERTGPREGATRAGDRTPPEADKTIGKDTEERWQVTKSDRRWSETATDGDEQ
ncbi:MAG TPA: hypothetical protein VF418_10550 [Sphingomonadaceae bacterium]